MSKRWITLYDEATGEIRECCQVREGEEDRYARFGLAWKPGRHDGDVERINPATRRANKHQPLKLRQGGNTIWGFPDGARVRIDGRIFEPVDGSLTLKPSLGLPQTVTVEIQHHSCGVHCETLELDPDDQTEGIEIEQDASLLRRARYEAELPDGEQMDAYAKAMDEVLAALPDLDGPGVREARALIEKRKSIKGALPKP